MDVKTHVLIELRVVHFLSEIVLLISNHAVCLFDFRTTRIISGEIALRSVHLSLLLIDCPRSDIPVDACKISF